MEYERIVHPFAPVYDEHSEILILGTLPSVKSRENDFYYGHPQNRFWKVLAKVYGAALPQTPEEKMVFLLAHHIALWDVIESCEIKGSSDSSIRAVIPTDIKRILDTANIHTIFVNGKKAAQLYERYQQPLTGIPAVTLPSTSPANAAWNLERLCGEWGRIVEGILQGRQAKYL